MKKQLKILIVEDSEDDVLMVLNQFKSTGYNIIYKRVENANEMISALKEENWDVILSEYSLPSFNGLEVLKLFLDFDFNIPFIIISGMIGEEKAVEAIKNGAHDYVMKNNLKRLIPAIERALRESKKNRIKNKQLEEKMKEAEKLKLNENKFERLISDMPVGMLLQDSNGKILLINNEASELLELTPDQIVGKIPIQPEWNAIREDGSNFPGFMSLFNRVIKYQKPVKNIIIGIFRPKKGNRTWLFMNIIPMLNNNGELYQVFWTFIDRTERKMAIDALRESEELYRSILIASPDNITITDLEGKIIKVSPSALSMFGYESTDEIVGRSIMEFIAPGDVNTAITAFKNMFNDNKREPIEYSGLRKDGSLFDIEINGEFIRNPKGEAVKIVFIVRDISKRKQAEFEISKLTKAVEQSPSSIVITDKEGIIEYVNPYFTKVTGYTKKEAIGKNPRILKSGITSPNVFMQLWKTIASGNIWRGELCNKKKNGEIYWEWASISPLINSKGQITHYIGVKEDITKRKLIENEIKVKNEELTKLNLEKDKFFSIIAHDLRGPFNTFLGMTELLMSRISKISKKELLLFVTTIKDSANQLHQLLENLLQWANAQQGLIPFNPEPVNLLKLINDSISVIINSANSKNINIEYNIPQELITLVDVNIFQTIIRNLVSNAVKFTPKGGKITILANKNKSEMIELSVSDTGIGMDDNILNNLFQLNARIHRSGTEGEPSTGLGLLLCKDLVEKHNGKIWAESQIGKGTTFYFTLKNN